MAGGKTRGPRSAERRRQIRDRVALGVAALLLVVGLVVFFQSRTDSGPAPTQSAAPPVQTAPASNLKKGGTLEPDVRRVAARFLETAVGRTQLADAWDLATPELRSGVSRAEWMTGALPVPPFPVQGSPDNRLRRRRVRPEQGPPAGAARAEGRHGVRPDALRHDDRARVGEGSVEGQLLQPLCSARRVRLARLSSPTVRPGAVDIPRRCEL